MLLAAFTAIFISLAPKHHSPFLFCIGVFTIYLLITGYRSLNYKKDNPPLNTDKIISWIMVVVGVSMAFFTLILYQKLNILMLVFGTLSFVLAVQDLIIHKNADKLKSDWLRLHLIKMLAGYISATTAFIVVNQIIPGLYGWFIPGIIGSFFIAYFSDKVKKKTAKFAVLLTKTT